MNHSARHSYYVAKFIKWLRNNGYDADKCEFTGSIAGHYTKRDLWGADIAFKDDRIIGFIQVKTSKAQIAAGRRQLSGKWPPETRRLVGYWRPRAKEPSFVGHEGTSEFVLQKSPSCANIVE